MASTYKIGMAIKLLQHIEKGELALDPMVELTPEDLSPGSGMITPHLPHPGLALSIYNLLETMMTLSDNTATDKVLNLVGGPQTVTEWLHKIGIEDMRIDRPTKSLLCDAFDIPEPEGKWSLKDFQDQIKESTEDKQEAAARTSIADPRDTSTPTSPSFC
jgi:beta-lactamase class A